MIVKSEALQEDGSDSLSCIIFLRESSGHLYSVTQGGPRCVRVCLTGADKNNRALYRLYTIGEGPAIGLSFNGFAQSLRAVGHRCLPADISTRQVLRFYRQLHLKDLVLAIACSRGSAFAWERLVSLYREPLYAAALMLVKNDATARELSDSLWGDLFASSSGANRISSKLASYSGRGSLEGWLKAILTRTYLDVYRSQKHVVSLDAGSLRFETYVFATPRRLRRCCLVSPSYD